MNIPSTFVLFLLIQLSSTATHDHVGSDESAGLSVTDAGENAVLNGSSLTYGQLLQYLNQQESELEVLKNETQQCCGGQWTLWIENQQQSVDTLHLNVNHLANIVQELQNTVENLQLAVDDQVAINQHQQATIQRLQSTVDDQADIIQRQETTVQQMQTMLNQLSDKLNGPRDCMELLATGHDTSGVYTIYPDGGGKSPVHVYCDMDTDGGGWTLFQKRQDGSVNFYRDWEAYKTGFGDLRGEFWLGNDHLHRLTAQDVYELRVDLEDFEGNTAYAKYNIFRVEDEVHKYRLTVDGYNGTAGDGMTDAVNPHHGMYFTTRDRDNDIHPTYNCAEEFKGAWYSSCHRANLNGLYLGADQQSQADGVNWKPWRGYDTSLKTAEMKIRPN
ncbi:PREDICTED: ficolin-2-like [Branchiostoma belcheri]|uniref:Ficolin-2-like n=1 Tax=Branchiostoma belcheri TaxID=7741 RepID=A0A6P5AFY8_BRABE|nr:PREDICTED: ficolin-2-like [Branchiostoma belcheri]